MKVSLLKEDKIEQIVKYCMRIFEQERAECFVSSLNVIQTFQQLTIVRNLFFNNAIKAFGVLNDTTGEIEKIMIVRLADAIEYTAVIEIHSYSPLLVEVLSSDVFVVRKRFPSTTGIDVVYNVS